MEIFKWDYDDLLTTIALSDSEKKEFFQDFPGGNGALINELLREAHNVGIENACVSLTKQNEFFEFINNPNSKEQIDRILMASCEFGNSEIFVKFGDTPLSGPEWYKTKFMISSVGEETFLKLLSSIHSALDLETPVIQESAFVLLRELVEFLEDKLTGLNIRMTVENHANYKLRFELFRHQRIWAYLDDILCGAGMKRRVHNRIPAVYWDISATSSEEFSVCMKNILDSLEKNWNYETPDEPTDDMGFNLQALIMHKKFGQTREGIKAMNDWINSNNPDSTAPKVNY